MEISPKKQKVAVVKILSSNLPIVFDFNQKLPETLRRVRGFEHEVPATGKQRVQFDTMSMSIDPTKGNIASTGILEFHLVERPSGYIPDLTKLQEFVIHLTKQRIRELRFRMSGTRDKLKPEKSDLTGWGLQDEEWEKLSRLFPTDLL